MFAEFISSTPNNPYTPEEVKELSDLESTEQWISLAKKITKNNTAYFFSGNKNIITDRELNYRGANVLRLIISHLSYIKNGASPQYMNEGVVIVENYLNDQDHKYFSEKCAKMPSRVGYSPSTVLGPNELNMLSDVRKRLENCLGTWNKDMQKSFDTRTHYQRLIFPAQAHATANMLYDAEGYDQQNEYHLDTFFPSMKWWLFLNDTTENNALNYSLGSCQLTNSLFQFWYDRCLETTEGNAESWRTKAQAEGSLRASKEELKVMGYEMKPLHVKANTLIIANVGGFHARGRETNSNERHAIHGVIRVNPFI